MARWWQGVTLCVGWLGAVALVQAQAPAETPPAGGVAIAVAAADDSKKPETAPAPTAGPTTAAPPSAGPAGPPVPFIALPAQPGAYTTSGKVGPENAFTVDPLPGIPPECTHIGIDYLLWYLPRQPVPVLVTRGSTADPIPGALGQPGTRNGFDAVSDSFQFSGGRITVGQDLDCAKCLSVFASGFLLEQRSAFQAIRGTGAFGTDPLSRPFFNVNANRQDADPISFPGVMRGEALIDLPQRMHGADFTVRYNYFSNGSFMCRSSILLGLRYLNLEEGLTFAEKVTDLPGLGAGGNIFTLLEDFQTRNLFFGGQIGAEWEWRLDKLSLIAVGKLGIGNTTQQVRISGATQAIEADGRVTVARDRALLVQPSNAGEYERNSVGFVPEGELKIGYQCNPYVRLTIGYSFIYWSNTVRPGDQIDRTINIQALQPFDQVGPARPTYFGTENRQFWTQGLSLGTVISF